MPSENDALERLQIGAIAAFTSLIAVLASGGLAILGVVFPPLAVLGGFGLLWGFFVGGRQLAKLKPILVVAPAVIGLPMCVFLVGHGGDFWWLLLVLWFASNILLALVIGLQFHRNLLALSG
jgi:hypothetical protein